MKVLKCFVIVEVEVFSLLKLSLYFSTTKGKLLFNCKYSFSNTPKKVDVLLKLLLRLSLRTFLVSSKGSSLRVF
jgi:hypothetical protein